MVQSKTAFVVYGVHKNGLKDPDGNLFIDYGKIEAAKKALIGEGIDRDLARRVTEENDSGEERLARLIERKYRRKLAEPDGVRKVTQALLRLGFGTDEVRGALRAFTGQD